MTVESSVCRYFPTLSRPLAALLLAGGAPAGAPQPGSPGTEGAPSDYREGLKDADLSGLGEAERERVLAILNGNPCLCGCRYTLASCRVQDSECSRSRELAPEVVRRVRAGESDEQVQAFLRAQPILPRPLPETTPALPRAAPSAAPAGPLLDPHVYAIPIEGAPVRNPVEAPVTIVEFADFQCGFCAQSEPLLA